VLVPSLAIFLAGLGVHPESLSHSRVRVEGARASLELRFQALSLIEVRPELDRTRDGYLDEGEVAAAREEIGAYLLQVFRLLRVAGEREEPLAGKLVALVPEDPAGLGALELQSLDARFAFEAPEALEVLVIESRLFHEANPWHKDLCSVAWNEAEPVPHAFAGAETRWRFEPAHVRRPGVLVLFLELGVDHILTGFDHQAFLLALLVASRRVRSLVGVVTAFTLAHSITLAAAALGWVSLSPRFVELAIALSIAYVACDNLLRKEAHTPWLEAFAFGLLHGLGFAGFLGEALEGEPLIVTALLGFNLGVELGQLALVSVAVLLLALLFRGRRARGAPGTGLVPPVARIVLSIPVACAGFYWFAERAGWLSWA
jgi:hypothetical protein